MMKKWLVLFFQSDQTYMVMNTKSKGVSECLKIEDGRISVKFPDAWYEGEIVAEEGKKGLKLKIFVIDIYILAQSVFQRRFD